MIAYFSMEIGLEPKMPTYAGGLGELAGDGNRMQSRANDGAPGTGDEALDGR